MDECKPLIVGVMRAHHEREKALEETLGGQGPSDIARHVIDIGTHCEPSILDLNGIL